MKSLISKDKKDNGFSGIVPSEPTTSKPSKFNVNKDALLSKSENNNILQIPGKGPPFSKGRKVVDTSNSNKSESMKISDKDDVTSSKTSVRGKKQVSNEEELDKLLENDAGALLNMRKDILVTQAKELEKARAYLATFQKKIMN